MAEYEMENNHNNAEIEKNSEPQVGLGQAITLTVGSRAIHHIDRGFCYSFY